MRESGFWKSIKRQVTSGQLAGKWRRVEAKYPPGLPDAHVLLDGGRRTVLVELKSVKRLAELPGEVRADQAVFARSYKRDGGECYLFVRVGELGRDMWFDNAFDVRQGLVFECPCPLGERPDKNGSANRRAGD